MRRSLPGGAAATLLVLLAVMLSPAASSEVDVLECGTTITTDTTLQSDLVDCPNNGIVIGADGVTLDLNGHMIDGDAAEFADCGEREPCDMGVATNGHDGVTIENGSVREFAVGVYVGRARNARVEDVASSRHAFFGFVVVLSAKTQILDSSGDANPKPDGDGLGVFGSHDLRIVGNAFRGNGQLGIHVEDSEDLVIARNLIARNHDMGVLLEGDRNRLRRNRCVRNGACMIVAPGDRNVIARNHAIGDGDGIAIEKGRGNLVARNTIVRPRKNGITLGLNNPPIGGARNVVRANRVRGAGRDGFFVSRHDDHSLLARNRATASGDDGFDVRSASATLTGNRSRG